MSDLQDTPSIIHITHHKAGSQWVYTVLQNLFPLRVVHPQKDSGHFTNCPVLPGRIYPTVYASKAEFDAIPIPGPHRTFVVIRDLRDTLVSAYFHYSQHRKDLMNVSKEEGFRLLMETFLHRELELQRTWVQAGVPVFHYEDMMADASGVWRKILDSVGLQVSDSMLEAALKYASFEARSGRKPGQEDAKSHYRKGTPGDWKNHLQGELLTLFKQKFAQGLIDTGYETTLDWGQDIQDTAPTESAAAEAATTANEGEDRVITLTSTELRDKINKRLTLDRATLTRQLDLERLQRPEWLLQQDFLVAGDGWYLPDTQAAQKFVWVGDLAGLQVQRASGAKLALNLEVEAGGAIPSKEFVLQVSEDGGTPFAELPVKGRRALSIPLPAGKSVGETRSFHLRVVTPADGFTLFEGDPRVLAYKVFSFGLTAS
jgi:hypothetical protein